MIIARGGKTKVDDILVETISMISQIKNKEAIKYINIIVRDIYNEEKAQNISQPVCNKAG